MEAQPKIVMQVTITPEECPDLHRELSGITSARRRVKRFLKLADLGLLVEQGRVGVSGLPQRGAGPARDERLGVVRAGQPGPCRHAGLGAVRARQAAPEGRPGRRPLAASFHP